jgi:pyruvate dehydrogenase phosphatase
MLNRGIRSFRQFSNSCFTSSYASNSRREDRDFSVKLSGNRQLVGVIDGHSGSRVAEMVSKNLPDKMVHLTGPANGQSLKQAYLEVEAELFNYVETVQQGLAVEGACVLSALIEDDWITVANAGDSGALLIKSDFSFEWLNEFHNAGNPKEQKRLISEHPSEHDVYQCFSRGGRATKSPFVTNDDSVVCYTKGLLQPTKAVGDFYLKHKKYAPRDVKNFNPPYLTAEPDIVKIQRTKNLNFLILATDGLWEILSAEDVIALLKTRPAKINSANEISEFLLDETLSRGAAEFGIHLKDLKEKPTKLSTRHIVDDLTITVVDLR